MYIDYRHQQNMIKYLVHNTTYNNNVFLLVKKVECYPQRRKNNKLHA
jgi:hypothetical protein